MISSENENVLINDAIQIERDQQMAKIKEDVLKSLKDYQKTISYMASDAPISILCLPKKIEKILLDNGLLRIYDLFNVDFVKIKGLSESNIRNLTARLNEFIPVF